jgi:hypothetical protein
VADVVEIILALRNVRGFVADAEKSAASVKAIGTESEVAGAKASIGWKGIAKWGGVAAGLYGVTKLIRSSVSATDDLARSTLVLQRSTNMDSTTASEWVGVAKERNITTTQFQVALVKLSKTMETARTGTNASSSTIANLRKQIDMVAAAGGANAPKQLAKLTAAIAKAETQGDKSRKALAALGVPMSELQKGDTADVLLKAADAMKRMQNPAERLALANTLFGKSGRLLLPILMQGSVGVRKLLDEEKAAGNYIGGKSIQSMKTMIAQQRELSRSWEGAKVQLGTALMPVLLLLSKFLILIARLLRPITSNAKLLTITIVLLTGSLIALKIATIAAAVAEGKVTMATKAYTAAQWLLNAAMDANPIGLIVLGIAALVVGFVLAYKHIKVFRDGVNDLWHMIVKGAEWVLGWLKANWPYVLGILGGPFTLAAVLIIKHFGAVKDFVLAIIAAIKQAFGDLISWIMKLPKKIGSVASKIPGYGIAKKVLGFLADGGVVSRSGQYVVGERGPEIVNLPSGASVTPMITPALAGAGMTGGGGRPLQIVVPVMLNAREIARATAQVTADRLARR